MYQVVFTGRLLAGADRTQVEAELKRLFKATPQQVEWFLRGKTIVVKSCEDLALARRYEAALIKAGLECELRGEKAVPAKPVPEHPAQAADKEQDPAPQQTQLPIPGVSPAHDKPARSPKSPVVRREPTLGPVTRAMTAQDRAPVVVTRPTPFAVAAARLPREEPSRAWRGIVLALLGSILLGVAGFWAAQQWLPRLTPGPVSGAPALPPSPPVPVAVPEKPLPPEQLILGLWQCFENGLDRIVQNEFMAGGRYRSLSFGKPDAFLQVEQIDLLVEGQYRLKDQEVVLHVQKVPSRELFGEAASTDEYLYWNIHTLTPDVLVWTERSIGEDGESCLRSQVLPQAAV